MKLSSIAGAAILAVATVSATPTAAVAQAPLLTVTDLNVTGIQLTGPNSLLATVDLTGQLVGRDFTLHNLQVPVTFEVTDIIPHVNPDGSIAACPVLHLELEIERLNLLGLVVELNNCQEGPIELDIVAEPGALLGDLLCGLLGPDGLLDLSGGNLADFLSLVEQVLDAVLGELTGSGAPASPPTTGGSNQASPLACPVLELELGAIELDLLGLVVTTTDICLFVYAEPGAVLGDLLCSLVDALNAGSSQRALNALARQIVRTIVRRGL